MKNPKKAFVIKAKIQTNKLINKLSYLLFEHIALPYSSTPWMLNVFFFFLALLHLYPLFGNSF